MPRSLRNLFAFLALTAGLTGTAMAYDYCTGRGCTYFGGFLELCICLHGVVPADGTVGLDDIMQNRTLANG